MCVKLVFDSKVLQVQVSPILYSLVAWLTSHSPIPYNAESVDQVDAQNVVIQVFADQERAQGLVIL